VFCNQLFLQQNQSVLKKIFYSFEILIIWNTNRTSLIYFLYVFLSMSLHLLNVCENSVPTKGNTARWGQVISNLVQYSEIPGFKFCPGHRLFSVKDPVVLHKIIWRAYCLMIIPLWIETCRSLRCLYAIRSKIV